MLNDKNCIARRLKEARLTFGISQKKLGILAGIDEHSASARMNQYEMGKHIPNFSTLQHIADVLDYPLAFFTTEDDLIAELIYLIGRLEESDKHKMLAIIKNVVLCSDKRFENEVDEKSKNEACIEN